MTQAEARELFDYSSSGDLIWKRTSRNGRARVGEKAGSRRKIGYICIGVKGRRYFAHRLVYLWHYGYVPENDIDHINQIRDDNRIENLREVSKSCNALNAKIHSTNKSGIKGISVERDGRFGAVIKINNRSIRLGVFDDITEAAAHRLAAEQCLGLDTCEFSSAHQHINNFVR